MYPVNYGTKEGFPCVPHCAQIRAEVEIAAVEDVKKEDDDLDNKKCAGGFTVRTFNNDIINDHNNNYTVRTSPQVKSQQGV